MSVGGNVEGNKWCLVRCVMGLDWILGQERVSWSDSVPYSNVRGKACGRWRMSRFNLGPTRCWSGLFLESLDKMSITNCVGIDELSGDRFSHPLIRQEMSFTSVSWPFFKLQKSSFPPKVSLLHRYAIRLMFESVIRNVTAVVGAPEGLSLNSYKDAVDLNPRKSAYFNSQG
jgi:hypothetical protein